MLRTICLIFLVALHVPMLGGQSSGSPVPSVTVDWNQVIAISKTTLTLQVVENPPLRRGSAIHNAEWNALQQLHADKVRMAFWYPYPKLAVAELDPPTADRTSWDFSLIDPIVEDFFAATQDTSRVLTFSTIPQWMFRGSRGPWAPPQAEDAVWNYEYGDVLNDPTGKKVVQYFARVVDWYAKGGFTDEAGKQHLSGHHYPIAYWEVLNEPEYEHAFSIQQYTALYDAIAESIHQELPTTKLIGMSLAMPEKEPEAFEYFLNPKNHKAGTPLDAVSFHFYAVPEAQESEETQDRTFFLRAEQFVNTVRYIRSIRDRLSPATELHLNEAGCIAADDLAQGAAHTGLPVSDLYWHRCAAMTAYLYGNLVAESIDVFGVSQLLGYPSQFPSVSLLDWKTGMPNPRYRALQLLKKHFHAGDRVASAKITSKEIYVSAFLTSTGRKLLLVNTSSHPVEIRIPAVKDSSEEYVDLSTGSEPAKRLNLHSGDIRLGGFCVAVVTLP